MDRIVLYPGKRIKFKRGKKLIRATILQILDNSVLCLIEGEVEEIYFSELFN